MVILPLLSAFFILFALTSYVVLDGFDLGVGILLLFQPMGPLRDHMVDSITPTWDGNETWLIMAGVTLLAAFPPAYAILMPALYLPVIAMLLSLGLRGVTFEFRVQMKPYRHYWDLVFGIGSLNAAMMQGLILGNLIQGITLQNGHFAGNVFDVFRTLPLLMGLLVPCGYILLGGGWLYLKATRPLQRFSVRCLRIATPILATLCCFTMSLALRLQPAFRSALASHRLLLLIVAILAAALMLRLATITFGTSSLAPFLAAVTLFLVGVTGAGIAIFPNIIPFELSIWDAASPAMSQKFILFGAACVTPIVLGYSAFAYWVFRGRTPDDGWGE